MDILDSFGDWVQLFGIALGYTIVLPFVFELMSEKINEKKHIPLIPFIILINFLIWILVYDYDIVLGFLLGGVITAVRLILWYSKNVTGSAFLDPAMPVIHGRQGASICGVITVVVALTKIILFW